jgi:nitrate reductase NapAB chaperone NapD
MLHVFLLPRMRVARHKLLLVITGCSVTWMHAEGRLVVVRRWRADPANAAAIAGRMGKISIRPIA